MRTDFRRDILAGRLRFLSPSEILRYRPEDRQGLFLWLHPVLGSIYDWEKALFARQQASSSSYRRAMVISGGLFVLDVSEALQERGLEVHGYDPLSKDQKQVVEDIISLAPDLILSVNYRHGLPEISSTLGIPVLVWEIDPTIERLVPQRTSTPHTYIYTYRKSNVARFREAGFEHVEYLPLAANPRRRYPKDLNDEDFAKYGADVSFAGSSMTEQAEVLGQLFAQMTKGKGFPANPNSPVHDYTSLWQLALTNQLHNPDRYVVEDVFNQHLPLGSWVIGNGQNRLVDLVACTAETAASHRRAQALSTLAQLRNGATVRVWGDDGWCRLLPETIDYSGPVGHFHELTAVYNASRVNLDINRIYQRDIATMRVFDVMACRGFLLADYSDDLGELFELESEVIAYRSLAEIPSLVKHFLNHPSEREQVAIAGYERVLKEHTIQMRVESMLNNLP
jgi:spore maturation protein CgeB